ncbi:hypothetical protein [Tenacibaculum sp. 190524A02b]|uniref:hypothetical protein n=1 Tax=Tenacibaculum vairaonense TaxID=3137860 RepID=UPI0031FB4FC6
MKNLNYFFYLLIIFLTVSCSSDSQDETPPVEEPVNTPPTTVQNITYELIDFPNITFKWDKSTDIDGDPIKYLISINRWTDVGLNDDYIIDVSPKAPTYETTDNSFTIKLNKLEKYSTDLQRYTIIVYAVEKDFTDYSSLTLTPYTDSESLSFVPLGTNGVHFGDIVIQDHLQLDMLKGYKIHTLNGNLSISIYCTTEQYKPYEINNLKSLKSLKKINGNLIIGGYTEASNSYSCANLINNFDFTDLEGLNNLEHISGNLIISETRITNLNHLEKLANVTGKIGLYGNFELTDFCTLSDLFKRNNFELDGNAYNPSLNDFLNNSCSK